MTVSTDPSAIAWSMSSRPGMGRHVGRAAGQRPASLYAGHDDPPDRRLHLRGRGELGHLDAAGRPSCPRTTSNWWPPPVAGPCWCPRPAARPRARPRAPTRSSPSSTGWCSAAAATSTRGPTARNRGPRWAASTPTATPASGPCWPPPCGPTCPCSPSAGAARSSTSSSAAPCTSTCPTWSATWPTARAPFVFGDVEVETVPGHPGRRRLRSVAHGALLAPPVHRRPRPRPGHHRLRRRRRHRGGRAPRPARFVLGVQWHPEEGMDQRPFDALVEAAVGLRRGAFGAPQRVSAPATRPGGRRHRGQPRPGRRAGRPLRRRRPAPRRCAPAMPAWPRTGRPR